MFDHPLPPGGVSDLHPARGGAGLALVALAPGLARKLCTPDFEIDLLEQCARYPDGEEVHFTPRQWRLLELLVYEAPRAVRREVLCAAMFGSDVGDEDFYHLAIVIARVRAKLEPDPHFPVYLRGIDAETFVFDPTGRGD
jgi:DNA-binding response OmpR family regulator